jgi:homospermidine synthase
LRQKQSQQPTAVVTHGANPGLVSAFVKQALINIAEDNRLAYQRPVSKEEWATLAQRLDIKAIHIAERDTQSAKQRKKPGVFVNTWSVDGFLSEGMQPAELGWGTHEKQLPADGRHHDYGTDAAIYLTKPGLGMRVRSWSPSQGPYVGFLVTHGESISIADYFTLKDKAQVIYRPTVHYAYHPCDDTVLSILEMEGNAWQAQTETHILREEITEGIDELGVLLMGNEKGSYWFGSKLDIETARALAPHNTATSLQVAAGVLAGMVWALEHPNQGVVEPDELDYEAILQIATPYLGEMVGVYSDWTPLKDRTRLFPEALDHSDPLQFANFRVT